MFGCVVFEFCQERKCTCGSSKVTPTPLLSETTEREREWVVEHRTHEQTLGLFFLQEVGTLPDIVHHVGDELHSLCEVQGLAIVFSVLDTRLDMQEAVHRFQEASLLHQLVSLFKKMNSLSLLPGS